MRWSPLDAARLSSLSVKDSGARWLLSLAEAGVERLPGDAPPHKAMAELFDAAWALSACDEAVTETRGADALHFSAPPGLWLTVPGMYVGFIILAAFRDDFGGRLVVFGGLWGLAGLAALGLLLWIGVASWAHRSHRRREHAAAQEERCHAAQRVARARDTLLAEPFVLRVRGGVFLQHVPDLNRIEDRLRSLPPGAPEQDALQAQRKVLSDALQTHRQAPPATWSDAGLRLPGG